MLLWVRVLCWELGTLLLIALRIRRNKGHAAAAVLVCSWLRHSSSIPVDYVMATFDVQLWFGTGCMYYLVTARGSPNGGAPDTTVGLQLYSTTLLTVLRFQMQKQLSCCRVLVDEYIPGTHVLLCTIHLHYTSQVQQYEQEYVLTVVKTRTAMPTHTCITYLVYLVPYIL